MERLNDIKVLFATTNPAKVKKYGGKLTAKWVYGMVICNGKDVKKYSWDKDHFYFIDKPCKNRNPGYPLDSISIIPEFNKYLVELTEEEKKEYRKKDNIEDVVNFIISSVINKS